MLSMLVQQHVQAYLISCAGGPVGNGFGTLICLPLFLPKHAVCGLDGDFDRKAAVGARAISARRMVANCFMVVRFVVLG